MARASGLDFRIDTSEWNRLYTDLRAFDPILSKALRTKMRLIGADAVKAVKDALAEPTPEGNPSGPGRAALAAGTRMSLSFGVRSAGAKIVTSGSKLPTAHAALLKVYNLESFRHPVFGDSGQWVEESGRPYFQKPIEEKVTPLMYTQMNAALDEAVRAIGGRGR